MVDPQLFYAYVSSKILALVMGALSWFWKTLGRLAFVLLFLFAGIYNFWTAFARPEEYVSFIRLANGSFAIRFFLDHPTAVIAAIAVGQFAIAILISLRNWLVSVGLAGAIFFLLAIAPLGAAAGYPASLIMAVAAMLLLRAKYPQTLWHDLFALVPHTPHLSGPASSI